MRCLRLPWSTGLPVQVDEVCLPFVLVKTARGQCRMLDVRRHRLARVSWQFGQHAFKQFKAEKREAARDESEEK